MYWNSEPVVMDELNDKMRQLVIDQEDNPINLRIRADAETQYDHIAKVMAAARNTGVRRLGFITTPDISTAPVVVDEADKTQASKAADAATESVESATATSNN